MKTLGLEFLTGMAVTSIALVVQVLKDTALKTQGSTKVIPLTDDDRVMHNSSSALFLLLQQVQPSLTKVNKCSSSQGYLRGRYSLPREGLGNEFEVLSLILSMMTVI